MSPKYVGFGEAISLFFSNYVNFKGRSTRSEYWYATLFTCLVSFVLGLISGFIGNEILVYIFSAAIFIPGWSSTFRRLHDAGRSALWLFLLLIPLVGAIIILVFECTASVPENKWGAPASAAEEAPSQPTDAQ